MQANGRSLSSERLDVDLSSPGPLPEEDIRRLRVAREHFLGGRTVAPGLRPLVSRSWNRCAQLGVHPDARRLEAQAQPHLEARLRRAVHPALTRLGDLIASTGAAVILADPDGAVADVRGEPAVRRQLDAVYPVPGALLSEDLAGTNAIGTAIEEGVGVQVWSGEHFVEAFLGFFCTAIPIRDPLSGRSLAILDLTIRERDVSPAVARLLAQIVANAASEVERALAERLASREQALLFHYLQELRRRAAVIAFDGRTTIASEAALALLGDGDLAVLRRAAQQALRADAPLARAIALPSGGAVHLEVTPRYDGGACVGALLRLRPIDQVPVRELAAADASPAQAESATGRLGCRLSRLEQAELQMLRSALHEAGGNRARAAALLGIGRSTLYRKLDVYRLRGFSTLP